MQEAARSGGEELMGVSMGAQGGSRAVGMWEGAAMQVADLSKRVVSGRQACCAWAACSAVRCAQEAARSGGEVLDREFGGAQGGSRAVGMV